MQIGIFTVDLGFITTFLNQSPWAILGEIIALGGWLFLAKLLFFVLLHVYEDFKQDVTVHQWKYVLLAVDIPALNVQTPKAVEQMFSQLAGAYARPDLKDRLKDGYKQRWFSFEIISIEGYIQFLIWTEEAFRDLAEAVIYAQYPDADVVEVEDYIGSLPDKFPNPTHDVWVSDFGLAENNGYPIRSYREFEHAISKDTVLKDPMGTFLESFSRLGSGEQMWFQILVEPINNDWKEGVIKKIKEIIGEKDQSHGHNTFADHLSSVPVKFLEAVGDQVFNREVGEAGGHEERSGPPNQLQYLTPGMSKLVEAMEMKISKLGFKTKMRGIYAARKEVFNPRRGVNALVGAINQYNIPSANSIVPTFGGTNNTKRGNKKKNLLVKAYKKRKINAGGPSCVLNIEELATVWHFPMSHVKTPQLQKAANKQAEPPVGLPVERLVPNLPIVDGDTPVIMPRNQSKEFKTDRGDTVTYNG